MAVEQQLAIQGKGLAGAVITGASVSVTWIEQANAYVDLAAGILACITGLITIGWYIYRFKKARGVQNDKADTS